MARRPAAGKPQASSRRIAFSSSAMRRQVRRPTVAAPAAPRRRASSRSA
jgi:hypothetical protein